MESKDRKGIPQFQSQDEEATFWLEHDFTNYYDPSKWVKVQFPNLKPSAQSATTCLPEFHTSKSFEKN
jgi:hypothetical protein